MTTFEIKQENDKFLFEQKQEEDKLIHNLQESVNHVKQWLIEYNYEIDTHRYCRECTDLQYLMNKWTSWRMGTDDTDSFNCRLRQLLDYRVKHVEYLYFTFGKYKDRIVQAVLSEDKTYCQWFSDTVVGKDFNTLKILDFLNKKLKDLPYIDKNKEFELDKILQQYVPTEWHAYVDREYLLGTKNYSGGSIGDVGLSPWEETMMDVMDYGDLC